MSIGSSPDWIMNKYCVGTPVSDLETVVKACKYMHGVLKPFRLQTATSLGLIKVLFVSYVH